MNLKDWQKAYEPLPPSLDARVQYTLAHLDDGKQNARMPLNLKTAVIVLALLLALAGIAYAVFFSPVAAHFGWFYGEDMGQKLMMSDVDSTRRTYQLGDVVYTIEEMILKSEGDYQGLYGVVRITPAEGSNIILIPEDYSVNDPAKYVLHYGFDEGIPEDALSYAEFAMETQKRIIMARLTVSDVSLKGETVRLDVGESWTAQPDGSILGGLEVIGDMMEHSDVYELNLWVSNWQITPEGEWLREEPDNTWLQEDWRITVQPTGKGEGK